MSKKNILELVMAVMLLSGVFFLSKEGAKLVSSQTEGKKTVVLDAGHGAADPGKIGTNDLKEKDLNLAITLKLKKLLEKQGIKVIMTRSDDKPLHDEGAKNKKAEDMQKRVALINGNSPDCAISIHQNSYSQSDVKGAQVFYYQSSNEGKELGETVQAKLIEMLDKENHRQVKGNSTYYLLKKTEVPLVIVECGFLSNPEEAALLGTKEYQTKVAEAVAAGVVQYLEGK